VLVLKHYLRPDSLTLTLLEERYLFITCFHNGSNQWLKLLTSYP